VYDNKEKKTLDFQVTISYTESPAKIRSGKVYDKIMENKTTESYGRERLKNSPLHLLRKNISDAAHRYNSDTNRQPVGNGGSDEKERIDIREETIEVETGH
jgi:hypothetical protein